MRQQQQNEQIPEVLETLERAPQDDKAPWKVKGWKFCIFQHKWGFTFTVLSSHTWRGQSNQTKTSSRNKDGYKYLFFFPCRNN